jgi:hypothetical protein
MSEKAQHVLVCQIETHCNLQLTPSLWQTADTHTSTAGCAMVSLGRLRSKQEQNPSLSGLKLDRHKRLWAWNVCY